MFFLAEPDEYLPEENLEQNFANQDPELLKNTDNDESTDDEILSADDIPEEMLDPGICSLTSYYSWYQI